MKSVQVFPNVRYVSLQDDEGPFGMFLISEDNSLYSVREVQSKEEFVKGKVLSTDEEDGGKFHLSRHDPLSERQMGQRGFGETSP